MAQTEAINTFMLLIRRDELNRPRLNPRLYGNFCPLLLDDSEGVVKGGDTIIEIAYRIEQQAICRFNFIIQQNISTFEYRVRPRMTFHYNLPTLLRERETTAS